MSAKDEAPKFKREPYPGTAHYVRCYDLARRRSLVVKAEAGSVDLACHMHDALYVTLELSVADARAIAAELIAAADAAEQQREAA